MMGNRIHRTLGVLLSAFVVAQTAPVSTQGPVVDGKPVQVFSGRIRGGDAVTFTSDRHWVLRGAVFVEEGGVLNVQAGTRVVGESGSVGTLVVLRGGRLNAIGTRENPIVFQRSSAGIARAR
jgi:hypothetical protein